MSETKRIVRAIDDPLVWLFLLSFKMRENLGKARFIWPGHFYRVGQTCKLGVALGISIISNLFEGQFCQ